MGLFSKPKFVGYSIETAFDKNENKRYWCVFSLFQESKKQPIKKLSSYETDMGTNRMQFSTKQEAIDKLYSIDKNPKIVFIENIDKVNELKNLEINQDILKSVIVNGTKEFWFYNIRTFFGMFNKKMIFKGAYANQISFKQYFPDGTNKPGLIPEQLLIVLLDNQKRLYENSQDFESLKKFNTGISMCLDALKEWDPSRKVMSKEFEKQLVDSQQRVDNTPAPGRPNYEKSKPLDDGRPNVVKPKTKQQEGITGSKK